VALRYSVSVDDLARRYRVPHSALTSRNYAWLGPVRKGFRRVSAGTTVWVRQDVARLASGHPRPSAF